MWQRELNLVLCGDRGVRWKGGWGKDQEGWVVCIHIADSFLITV